MQPCYWSIDKLPGLPENESKLLQNLGVATTKDLLNKAHSLQAKQTLAGLLKINIKYVNKWVALADLARLPSVGCQYCGLLLHVGIASVKQLAQTPIHRLHPQIMRLHVATMQRKDLCPSVDMVRQWVREAKLTNGQSRLRRLTAE